MTLKFRFSLAFVSYTMLVLGLFGVTYYVVEGRAASRAQEAEQIKTLEKVASVCREMVLTDNIFVATNYIGVVKKEPSVDFVSCVSPQGRVLAHSDPKQLGRQLSASEGAEILRIDELGHREMKDNSGHRLTEWRTPVIAGANKVGIASIGYRDEILKKDIQLKLLTTLKQLGLVAGSTFILAILVGLILSWNLSRPISLLADEARAIGTGQWEHKTGVVERNDELGVLAREMRDMAQKLKGLDELKDQFISHVSHDLRSPMASIKMYLDYILEQDENKDKVLPAHRRILTIIMHNAARLSVYVSNILDAAKIKAGKMDYHLQPTDVAPILKSIHDLYAIVAQQTEVRLTIEAAPNLPEALADPQRLEQVVANLVSNAFKFTRSGGSITMGAKPTGNEIEIFVSDTGKGIAKEMLPHLFKPFHQVDVAEQRAARIQGTGLGLFIVQETVTAMGGRVSIESELNRGTRFAIRLPRAGRPS